MKKNLLGFSLILFVFCFAGVAHADLQGFLDNLNVQARADLNGFSAKISAQFNIPLPRVQTIIAAVPSPADAFMCFQLGVMTEKSPESVLQTYKRNKGRGWGVIAKQLGIKPGSREFHALKRGDFELHGNPSAGKTGGKGKKGITIKHCLFPDSSQVCISSACAFGIYQPG